jgi:hypothetical protein
MTGAIITVNQTLDTTNVYNVLYNVVGNNGAAAPIRDVADVGEGLDFDYNVTWQAAFSAFQQIPRSVRFMTDSDKIGILTAGTSNTQNHGFRVYVNGVPVATSPAKPSAVASLVAHTITFPTAAVRHIEIRMWTLLGGLYTQKPFSIWKPPARTGPRVLVIGDSWTSSASVSSNVMNAAYWDIGKQIGSDDVWVDHYGGTGYGVGHVGDGTGATSYIHRLEPIVLLDQTWNIANIQPDVLIVHGGGANDKFKGRTNAQVIESVTQFFETARTKLPNAKLVFVEGFTPPGFNAYLSDYIAIRTAAQAALTDTGVYYIDTATTQAWFRGIGTASAPNADGLNNNNYITADTYHKNDAGHLYLRNRIAPKIRRIIEDRGDLVNTLI